MRTLILVAISTALGACGTPQPTTAVAATSPCLSSLQEGVEGSFTGEISSDGIHGIFLRTTDCPAEFVALEEGDTSTDIEYAELVRRIYREGNIGTLNKHISVHVRGRVAQNAGRVTLVIVDVESVSPR